MKRPILGRLSAGSGKPARRFVSEALYGIMARQSVRLTEIGRALEETIPLNKTETRLSRNLGRPEPRRRLEAAVLGDGWRRIGKRTLPVLTFPTSPSPKPRRWNAWLALATAAPARSPTATDRDR